MMLFKKRAAIATLAEAFPIEYRKELITLCRRMRFGVGGGDGACFALWKGRVCSREVSRWSLSSGEEINVPYRVSVGESLLGGRLGLTPTQTTIYHCILSRSCDGFVRERHVRALLEGEAPEWAMPYVIKLCDEYVPEILQAIYERLRTTDCTEYRRLCERNLELLRLSHSRMICYWSRFYRYECYRYRDWIGRRLYGECFGYRRTGQKNIDMTLTVRKEKQK